MRLKNQSILRKIAVPALILAGISVLISAYATISVERLVETVSIQDKVAARLARQADMLRSEVERFLGRIRAA